MRMGRDIGLDRLSERENHLRARVGLTQEQFIVGVAEITGLEQHRRGVGAGCASAR